MSKVRKDNKVQIETIVLHTNESYLCGKITRRSEDFKENNNCKHEELNVQRVLMKTVIKINFNIFWNKPWILQQVYS